MKKIPLTIAIVLVFSTILFLAGKNFFAKDSPNNGAPPYQIEDLNPPENIYGWLQNWQRPNGPPKVGLQAGHWKNNEVPEELHRLEGNTGSTGGGRDEWEVNLTIAERTKTILESKGVSVDILPTTVPSKYWADVFIAIHADGSTDKSKSGFKAAAPRRDFSGNNNKLLEFIETAYQQTTGFTKDANISRNMTGYYAFAWWRYDHAVNPMTASVILEIGFLTNSNDRRVIVSQPQVAAQGIASGIIKYLESEKLLP